jgi:hypothetical protein
MRDSGGAPGWPRRRRWRSSDSARAAAEAKFFGRYKGGTIRGGVLLSVEELPSVHLPGAWCCDTEEVVSVMDTEVEVVIVSCSPAGASRE